MLLFITFKNEIWCKRGEERECHHPWWSKLKISNYLTIKLENTTSKRQKCNGFPNMHKKTIRASSNPKLENTNFNSKVTTTITMSDSGHHILQFWKLSPISQKILLRESTISKVLRSIQHKLPFFVPRSQDTKVCNDPDLT